MRYFTVINSNIQYNGGRYMTETPKNVAKKSAKFLVHKNINCQNFLLYIRNYKK